MKKYYWFRSALTESVKVWHGGRKENIRKLRHEIRCSDRNSNQAPSKYKSKAFQLQPDCVERCVYLNTRTTLPLLSSALHHSSLDQSSAYVRAICRTQLWRSTANRAVQISEFEASILSLRALRQSWPTWVHGPHTALGHLNSFSYAAKQI